MKQLSWVSTVAAGMAVLAMVDGAGAATPASCDALPQAMAPASAPAASRGVSMTELEVQCRRKIVRADSIVAVLRMMLAQEAPGTKRLDKPIPVGMPTGVLLAQQGVLAFDMRSALTEGLVSLRIEGPGMRNTITPLPASGSVDVPAAPFVAGNDYRWTLTTRRSTHSAEFSVADDATRTEVAARLADIARLPVDDTTRMVLQAAVYDDADLDSARDHLVRELRRTRP